MLLDRITLHRDGQRIFILTFQTLPKIYQGVLLLGGSVTIYPQFSEVLQCPKFDHTNFNYRKNEVCNNVNLLDIKGIPSLIYQKSSLNF